MEIARLHLEQNELDECKKIVEEGQTFVAGIAEADPAVHSSIYNIMSLYHKVFFFLVSVHTNNTISFSRSSGMRLNFTRTLCCSWHTHPLRVSIQKPECDWPLTLELRRSAEKRFTNLVNWCVFAPPSFRGPVPHPLLLGQPDLNQK